MESLPPLIPEPLSELPEPREWICDSCNDPLNVWDWGNHPSDATALPPAHYFACLVELTPHEQQLSVHHKQHRHHQMWFRVGEPPGTLVAWNVGLPDKGRKSDEDEGPIGYTAYIYAVFVDWWHDHWPQMRVRAPQDPCLSPSLQCVVIGTHVIAAPDSGGQTPLGRKPAAWTHQTPI